MQASNNNFQFNRIVLLVDRKETSKYRKSAYNAEKILYKQHPSLNTRAPLEVRCIDNILFDDSLETNSIKNPVSQNVLLTQKVFARLVSTPKQILQKIKNDDKKGIQKDSMLLNFTLSDNKQGKMELVKVKKYKNDESLFSNSLYLKTAEFGYIFVCRFDNGNDKWHTDIINEDLKQILTGSHLHVNVFQTHIQKIMFPHTSLKDVGSMLKSFVDYNSGERVKKDNIRKFVEPVAVRLCDGKDSLITQEQNDLFTDELFKIGKKSGHRTTDIDEVLNGAIKLYDDIVHISKKTIDDGTIINKWTPFFLNDSQDKDEKCTSHTEAFLDTYDYFRALKGYTVESENKLHQFAGDIADTFLKSYKNEYKKYRKIYTEEKLIK